MMCRRVRRRDDEAAVHTHRRAGDSRAGRSQRRPLINKGAEHLPNKGAGRS